MGHQLRVLVACEYSATVRDAFRALGHDAWSCDLLPTDGNPRWHYQDSIFHVLAKSYLHWDMMIAHPICTSMANSGAKHLYIGGNKENGPNPARWKDLERDAAFYRALKAAPIKKIVLENSVMHGHAIKLVERGRHQIVHPHFFGSPFFKQTQLELIGVEPLVRTHYMNVPKPGTDEHKAWSRCHRMPPGPDRGKERARFDPKMAKAMAWQWGGDIRERWAA